MMFCAVLVVLAFVAVTIAMIVELFLFIKEAYFE